MLSTHLSLHYHLVFSTKERRSWIRDPWEPRLHGYLGGILGRLSGVAEAIGGTSDHVHIVAGLKATHRLADVMREIKSSSSEWIHNVIGNRLFGWQDGYGAFTVGRLEIEDIKQYVLRQKEHHRRRTFQEEYLELLQRNAIEFDGKYLW